jgi:hypothetical protein
VLAGHDIEPRASVGTAPVVDEPVASALAGDARRERVRRAVGGIRVRVGGRIEPRIPTAIGRRRRFGAAERGQGEERGDERNRGSTPDGSTPGGSTPDGSTPGGSTPGGSTPAEPTPVTAFHQSNGG